jgi:lipopolysaccharide transport system permease protein
LRFLDVRELWAYRELVYFLTWRDVKVRYKQTAIGVAWAVLQPLAMMGVFTLLFGRLAKFPSGGVPYPLFVLAALLPWQLFSRAISESTNSLLTNQQLVIALAVIDLATFCGCLRWLATDAIPKAGLRVGPWILRNSREG